MIHTLTWRVPSLDALDFWEQRLAGAGVEPADSLGRALVLPPHLEHRRGQLDRLLTPINIPL